jgi:hypothetical protein
MSIVNREQLHGLIYGLVKEAMVAGRRLPLDEVTGVVLAQIPGVIDAGEHKQILTMCLVEYIEELIKGKLKLYRQQGDPNPLIVLLGLEAVDAEAKKKFDRIQPGYYIEKEAVPFALMTYEQRMARAKTIDEQARGGARHAAQMREAAKLIENERQKGRVIVFRVTETAQGSLWSEADKAA